MDNHHHHDNDCDCGCEHEHENFGPDFITLIDEEGKEYEMEFLDSIELDGNTYFAFCEAGIPDDSNEAIEVSIFRVETKEDDTEELVGLDDEDELERVYAAFLDQQPEDDEE